MVPNSMSEAITQISSAIASLMVAYAMFQNYFPYELSGPIRRFIEKLTTLMYPYVTITFPEYNSDSYGRSPAFSSIERYLNVNSTKQAKRLKANVARDSEAIVLTMAEYEEVTEEYQGIKLWWASSQKLPNTQTISWGPREDEKKFFMLKFHKKHREVITEKYLRHVLDEGKAITVKERRHKLFTNNKNDGGYGYGRSLWSQVVFEHPATFDTLAMEQGKKQEIIDDLITFTKSKDYYKKVGKAWKRGYLLYGPPGTGKSTMIAAIANLLKYDIYDLELTSVKDNTELRKLLIDTSSKSVVVIEDIDCSLDLTGQREKKKEDDEDDKEKEKDPVKEKLKKMEEKKSSEVTLSGLLNFIDGLWSASGGERIIIFTTNYVEKLDPALIRRGRMDKRIEMSYCGFEAFKVLARNYLDLESHDLFGKIGGMLEETKMSPADVAENLMPKTGGDDEETCLVRLIKALDEAKEEEKKKAEEEEKMKAEKLAKEEEEKKEKLAKEEEEKKNKDIKEGEIENGEVIKGENGNKENNGVKENGVATN